MKLRTTPGFFALLLLAALLFLSLLNLLPLHYPLAFLERSFFAPAYERLSGRSFATAFQENSRLRATLRDVLGENYEIKDRSQRTALASTIQNWAESRSFPSPILATVVTQYREREDLFFLLNRGSRDSVYEGAAVIMGRGVLVGRITHTTPFSALLKLTTAKDHKFAVQLDNLDKTPGLLQGMGEDESLLMELVPRDLSTDNGTSVVTSGLDAHIPSGLLVGVVQESRTLESTPWKQLVLTPLAHPSDLRVVGVLPGGFE